MASADPVCSTHTSVFVDGINDKTYDIVASLEDIGEAVPDNLLVFSEPPHIDEPKLDSGTEGNYIDNTSVLYRMDGDKCRVRYDGDQLGCGRYKV